MSRVPVGSYEFRRWAARASMTVLALIVLALGVRVAGEQDRTRASIRQVAAELELEITSDCEFKRQVALLPAMNQRRGQDVTPALAGLAAAARKAYVEKRCERAGYGPVPAVFTPSPSPSPPPR